MKNKVARFKVKFLLGSVAIGVVTLFPFQSIEAAKQKKVKTQALTACTLLTPAVTAQEKKTKSTFRPSTRPSVRPSIRPSTRPSFGRNSRRSSTQRQQQPCTIYKALDSSSSAYQAAIDYSQSNGEDAMLIVQGDTTLFERYTSPYTNKVQHYMESGTKSFSGVMAIAAVQDGLLSLDERVSDTITEWQSDPSLSGITVRQLLNLTSGIWPGTIGLIPTFSQALNASVKYPVETSFLYGPVPFQIFGTVMQRKLAPKSITDPVAYLQQRILTPIGVQIKYWGRLSDGNPNMSSGAALTAPEWAKFGTLLKQNGQWQGQQILDPALIRELLIGSSVNPTYGVTFWLNAAGIEPSYRPRAAFSNLASDTFIVEGGQGQRLIIIPSQNLVIVRFGNSDTFSTAAFMSLLPPSP